MSVFIPNNRETFYCRITVPLRLWSVIGRKEVWRSLQTTDKDLAQVRAEKWKASGRRIFLVLKRDGERMDKAMIEALVQQWLDEALDEDSPWHPQREDDLDVHQESLHESFLDNRWDRMTEQADDLLKAAGLPLLDHASKMFRLLCRRLLEGHMEWTRIQKERLNGNYRPFNTFVSESSRIRDSRQESSALTQEGSGTRPELHAKDQPDSTVLAGESSALAREGSGTRPFMEVVSLYFQENVPRSQRSAEQIKMEYKRFLKVVGGNRPIGSITKEDCRRYKEYLLQERKLQLATVIKWLGMVGAIYRWASKQGFVPDHYNPADGLSPNAKRAKAESKSYRDYTDEELLTVFSAEEFRSQRARNPERYWSVLICLFTGCRREEACQLNLCDLQEQDGIPFFNITDGKGQALKNDSSRRKVPIHSSLIQLGFMDYANGLRQQKGITRLFPQLRKERDSYGNSVGKWYTRLIREIGLGDKGLVLHGLRHTAITRLADAGANEKVRRVLVGHAGADIHDRIYNHSARMSMKLLQEGLEKLRYPEVMRALNEKDQKEEAV